MQSPTAVVFRALVMLACLVAIPLAAVVGKSLPEIVKGLVDGQWRGHSAAACGSLTEAPRFQPGPRADTPSGVSAQPPSRDGWPPQLQHPQPIPSWRVAPTTPPVVQAGYEAPARQASRSAVPGWPSGSVSREELGGPRPAALRVVPVHQQQSAIEPERRQWSAPGPSQPPEPSNPAGQVRPATDQFTAIQARLRHLGATYYLLESWGNRAQLYRFYCKMAVGGNPNYTHYFEATDSDPLQAMTRVLRQVETWLARGR
jgi:hypothetical protein